MPATVIRNRFPYTLAGFYFFFFASLGAFLPYWGLYLKALSFKPEQIGELMAVIMVTKVVAPNIWGWIADHTGQGIRLIRLATFLAFLVFSMLIWFTNYWWIMGILVVFSFFWNAALPQFEATTMNRLGANVHHYSKIRLWGSIGFIVSVLLLAPLFERIGIEALPIVMFVLLLCIWIDTLGVSDGKVPRHGEFQQRLGGTLKQPLVIALLLTCVLAQASHGPYYAFFSIYLQEHGYTTDLIGIFWALGVVAEVIIFLFMHRWLPLFGARNLLLLAMLLTTVRWLLIASFVQHSLILFFAQVLHAASFGIFHASAIHLVHQLFPGKLQGRGQALYSSLSFGLGGAIGSLFSGYIWSDLGPAAAYYMAAVLAGVGFLIVWRGITHIPTSERAQPEKTWGDIS